MLSKVCNASVVKTLTTSTGLGNRVIIVDLDLYTALRGEFGNNDRICDLAEERRVGITPKTVVECMQVGSSDNVFQMGRLAGTNNSVFIAPKSKQRSKNLHRWN